ncbi:MAG TPA: M28 family peptidase [Chitinophagaceae bacterium]|nr:M28 family peptidase [Chitinophagaceae bacterium]
MKANKERLHNDVLFLTSLNPPRNYLHKASLEKVCTYIETEFTEAGAKPSRQSWQAGDGTYYNILTSYNPAKEQRLIVGAHYDVCGEQPGADDNASAVAGLLEIVRLIFQQKPELDYRIDFVAYCLEEPPFFGTASMGSYIHAQSLHDSKAKVLGMISLEMIGYFSDQPHSQPFPSPELARLYPSTANFIIVVGIKKYEAFSNKVHKAMAKNAGIDVQLINFPAGESLAGLSDQRNYWKFDYPALMINDTAFIRNPNYHTKGDTIETLDFKKMAEVVDASYNAIISQQ